MFRCHLICLVVLTLACTQSALSNEAEVRSVKTTDAQEIDSQKDHFKIIFIKGWLSANDTLLMKILSKNKNTAATISASGTYFDGEQLKNSWVVENTDIGNKLDRPWGVANKVLLNDIPADTVIPNIVVKFELHREDRIKQILNVVQTSEPTIGVAVQPYLTYATLVDGIFNTLFGTDKTKYPFLLDAGLSDPNVKSSKGFFEHYVIGISPNRDGDAWIKNLDGSKLAYDSAKGLTYDGNPLSDHTYVIFLIQRAEAPDVQKLLFASTAPWAALGKATFYSATFPSVSKKEDVRPAEAQYHKNLTDCEGLLQRELRFSAFDRAKALYAFAQNAQDMLKGGCKLGKLADNECDTAELAAYEQRIARIFGLSPTNATDAKSQSKLLNQEIRQQLHLQ